MALMDLPANEPSSDASGLLAGKRVALVGRLASMAKRDAAAWVRRSGGVAVERLGPEVDMVVVGEEGLALVDAGAWDELFEPIRALGEQGTVEVLTETQFWQRLGLVDASPDIHRLYTPAMLAELLGVPVAVIRRWQRRGLIVPAREVRKLAYFDFQEVATARRLAELLAAGTSPRAIERKLEALGRYLPGVARPLAQLSVIVQGKEILLRQGDGLIEPGGQWRFDFEATDEATAAAPTLRDALPGLWQAAPPAAGAVEPPLTPQQLGQLAAELEEEGRLEAAAETYRAAMAAGGPSPECCFQLAELLYRLGDLSAARERYYMAVELDEDFVEARANLGCVLAELGQLDLAIAAFQGALAYHGDYADAHYHLARALDASGRPEQAEAHWQAFLDLAPNSPWADQARQRVSAGV